MTEWDGVLGHGDEVHVFQLEQYHNIIISAHCHTSVPHSVMTLCAAIMTQTSPQTSAHMYILNSSNRTPAFFVGGDIIRTSSLSN